MNAKNEFFETDRCVLDTLDLAVTMSVYVDVQTEPVNYRWTFESMPLDIDAIAFGDQFPDALPFLDEIVRKRIDAITTESVDSTTAGVAQRPTDEVGVEQPKRRRNVWKRFKKLAQNCIVYTVRCLCPTSKFHRE